MLETLISLVINKSIEVILKLLLEKVWVWLLTDKSFQRLNHFLKMQIFVLYLDWILLKTSLKSLPELAKESNSDTSG
ncbi:hypothetical protein [Nostoc sp. 'Lobaria pulmonaria (5183) cyanobiont']|uniref:hypothetical protein n=1 Tax=Nostoc sp. 'Lobaria pulmonaria (5183) cyanobiont' TaxID=1618022 RepID=UPI000CF3270C|nr:hypothetical protein [Nostoc sp. 'Lobaria pulmonaria (5183) cyanobiont']AVH70300.1 hypothetical protein NLP_1527 [Nostoc sp. 'Lobaria pulmonaria (5183) cyanobiont']